MDQQIGFNDILGIEQSENFSEKKILVSPFCCVWFDHDRRPADDPDIHSSREVRPEEIFDRTKFDTFIGTSYSVSPKFIEKYFSDFEKFELVVGIPEPSVQENVSSAVGEIVARRLAGEVRPDSERERLSTFEQFSPDAKRRFIEDSWKIWFSANYSIHSKFYLLSGDGGARTRVVFGSANLSEQAFDSRMPQYEDIMVFDNYRELYEHYLSRYQDDILPVVDPYVTKNILRRLKETEGESIPVKLSGDGTPIRPAEEDARAYAPLSSEQQQEIVNEDITDLLNHSNQMVEDGYLPEEVLSAKQQIRPKGKPLPGQQKEKQKLEEIVYKLIRKTVTKGDNKKPKAQDWETVRSAVRKEVPLTVRTSPAIGQMDDLGIHAPVLIDAPQNRSSENTGLFELNDNGEPVPYGKKISGEEIGEELGVIGAFIDSYRTYAKNANDAYLKRVFEALLYTYTAPFIWEIRKAVSEGSEDSTIGESIPNFLVLGSTAGSGKTTFLNCIHRLTGIGNAPRPLTYTKLARNTANNNRTSVVNERIYELMCNDQNSVYPILIDEIPPNQFDREHLGKLIVDQMNEHAKGDSIAPVIVTTNAEEMALTEDLSRRIYYLAFDHEIRDKGKATRNLDPIRNRMTTKLFGDFVCRMSERLFDTNTAWAQYSTNSDTGESKIDFLYHAREIFREYYRMAGIPVPTWFPNEPCSDSTMLGKGRWKRLYYNKKDSAFQLLRIDGSDVLSVKMDEIISTGGRYGQNADIKRYSRSLPSDVLWQAKDGGNARDDVVVMLDARKFYDWLDIPGRHRKKRSLRDRIMRQ